jgi:signal transduction histidine kinase
VHAVRGKGTVVVRARVGRLRAPRARDAAALEVAVVDTGSGIAPEDLDKLFVPFFTTRHEGTGLGLAISRRIVQAHGGELDVASRLGEGSTFTVRLPLGPVGSG